MIHSFYLNKVFCCTVLLCLASACKKQEEKPEKPSQEAVAILYMEANNDLRAEARASINELEEGLADRPETRPAILAYIKDNDRMGYLLRIRADRHPYRIASDTVRVFGAAAPSDPAQLRRVLEHVRDEYPSGHYNLVLWSHATSWAPAQEETGPIGPQAFGEDRGRQMDILDLRDALPMPFHCILFDACAMGSVEVLYEFRDKARYAIASPTDVLAEGFPYRDIVPHLTAVGEEDVKNMAKLYFDRYNNRTGLHRSATVSVTDLSKLDGLAASMAAANHAKQGAFSVENVQRLDFTAGFPVRLYDIGHVAAENYPANEAENIAKSIREAVVYKNSTPRFLGNGIAEFSGLSMSFVPPQSVYHSYHANLAWSRTALVSN